MFSRKEREFLRILAESPESEVPGRLESRFPNPTYRRRLFWGIRQKAVAAADDLELYAQAAARDPRVVRPQDSEVPRYTEPFAAVAKRVIEAAHSLRGAPPRTRGGDLT